ncbi:MAG: glycosyltransferase [Candidatus Riflebacteria bacterium]|nr:glycosyltransferase [Candidatus Riflebacteria bacterium]
MSALPHLVLIPGSYPFSDAAENTFLDPEIPFLREAFAQVFVVPCGSRGARLPLPSGVALDVGLADTLRCSSTLTLLRRALFSRLTRNEVPWRTNPWDTIRSWRRLLSHVGHAVTAFRWLRAFMARNRFLPEDCVFYTYWFDYATTALALLKRAFPAVTVVTRAHGFDLYEERHTPAYIPVRQQVLAMIDGVFPDSDQGTDYFQRKYALPGNLRIHTARLGVPDPGFQARPSADGLFRVQSCSFMVPVKRIDLLQQGIAAAASRFSDRRFFWHHFGDGPMRPFLEENARKVFPENVRWEMPGYPGTAEVFRHYREQPIDLFVNVSSSEGTPVAVMEAASCGIPLMATRVGGNPEIATPRNAVALPPHPSPEEVAQGLSWCLEHPEDLARHRVGSREIWWERYASARNFPRFAAELLELHARKSTQGMVGCPGGGGRP